LQQYLSGATFIALYGISYGVVLFTISIGLVLMLGLMRVVNLAHLAFAAFGGYLALSLTNNYAMPLALSIPIAVIMVAAFSVILERICYVRLYRASELDQVLMTIALMFLAVASLNLLFGPNVLPGQLPPELAASLDIAGHRMQVYRLFVVAVGAALLLALWIIFDRTGFGARLRAAVDNSTMAQAIGIDVSRLFSVAFALGTGLAALGGAVGYAILPLEPLYPFKYLALVLVVVVLTGVGNIKASAGVAVFVGVMDTACRFIFPAFGAFFIYVQLIGLVLWRDRGLFAGAR
jgi:branched-chain amino acid transport system permease protein